MSLLEQLFAIARNTLLESIRQPIVLVVCAAATILVVMSNPFSAWTMQDDQRMFVDIGLSTVFLSTAVLASFIATNVITREIDNRTVLTVVSKPVPRPVFVVGKFLGVSGAMVVAFLYLSLVFMLVEVHGTLQTARDPLHMPVILFGSAAVLGAVGLGAWMNYFRWCRRSRCWGSPTCSRSSSTRSGTASSSAVSSSPRSGRRSS